MRIVYVNPDYPRVSQRLRVLRERVHPVWWHGLSPNPKISTAKAPRSPKPKWSCGGQRTKLLKAPETGFAFFDGKIGNIASLAALASWRFKVFLGSGLAENPPHILRRQEACKSYEDLARSRAKSRSSEKRFELSRLSARQISNARCGPPLVPSWRESLLGACGSPRRRKPLPLQAQEILRQTRYLLS